MGTIVHIPRSGKCYRMAVARVEYTRLSLNGSVALRIFLKILQKLTTELLCDPAVPFVGLY